MEKRILISWFGMGNDFRTGEVVPNGPTANFHRHYYAHHEHILLYSDEIFHPQLTFLLHYIKREFPTHNIRAEVLQIDDVFDLAEVKTKTENFLLRHHEKELDIFYTPGTSIMQVAWYICHTTLNLDTRLIQLRAPTTPTSMDRPARLFIEVDRDSTPASAIIRQRELESPSKQEYLLTASIQKVYDQGEKVALAEHVSAMIYGASGTGKEHLAKFIHQQSPRKNRPFRAVNCAAFTDALLSAQLFGHTDDAFTSAYKNKKGLFEEANKGTLFLDEIGDISSFMQQSLLRVLQEGEIIPVGKNKPIKVNVRIITATNKNLVQLCKEGKFRWDLYYRLAVVELRLPTLAERGLAELNQMLDFFLEEKQKLFKRPFPLTFEKAARNQLLSYPFPGNVREMVNIIEHLYVFCQDKVHLHDLPERVQQIDEEISYDWKAVEKQNLKRAWRHFDQSKSKTLKAIGYKSLNTLKKKLRDYEIIGANDRTNNYII